MKELYLLRHGERNSIGLLTDDAIKLAVDLGKKLPNFTKVISSSAERSIQTAKLLSGAEPETDSRAGFYIHAEDNTRAISEYSISQNINFFDAANKYKNGLLAENIKAYAVGLNQLLDETLSELNTNERALIVSHDLTITTAMALRGIKKISSNYLSGYKFYGEKYITRFEP